MSITNENRAGDDSPLNRLQQELKQITGCGKSKREADLREAGPLIEQYLATKVPQKTVLDAFNKAYGYTLHPPGFRKMLTDERKRRAEAGEVVACAACGHPLSPAVKATEVADKKEGV